MEIISSIKNISQYEKIKSKVNGIVLGCQYSFYADNHFTLEEISSIAKLGKKDHKKVFVLLNKIMHVSDTNSLSSFIDSLIKEDVYIIFQDLGILQILKEKSYIDKGIYNPLTMITNYMDLLCYDEENLDGVGVSNEIPLKDVSLISTKSNKVFYLGFGYHPMYQTYRHIVSLYKEHSGLKFENKDLYLQEATRTTDRCPIIENDYGTVVFRNGVINTLKEFELLKDVKYLFIDGIFLKEEQFNVVISSYYDVINNLITKEEGLNLISALNIPENNNFMYEDSVYNPKEFE
jgi:U32 family peptidase